MFRLTKVLSSFLIILAAGCASGPSGKTFNSATGQWNMKLQGPNINSVGSMTIIDDTKATYSRKNAYSRVNGRILFNSSEGERNWAGYWVEEDEGPYECSEARDGSKVWGEVSFQFNEAFNEFKGNSNICGEGINIPWNGSR